MNPVHVILLFIDHKLISTPPISSIFVLSVFFPACLLYSNWLPRSFFKVYSAVALPTAILLKMTEQQKMDKWMGHDMIKWLRLRHHRITLFSQFPVRLHHVVGCNRYPTTTALDQQLHVSVEIKLFPRGCSWWTSYHVSGVKRSGLDQPVRRRSCCSTVASPGLWPTLTWVSSLCDQELLRQHTTPARGFSETTNICAFTLTYSPDNPCTNVDQSQQHELISQKDAVVLCLTES